MNAFIAKKKIGIVVNKIFEQYYTYQLMIILVKV